MIKDNYINYVRQLPQSEALIKQMIDGCIWDKNPSFYLEYASLFEKSFQIENSKEKIILLNIAGYLCYNYSLLLDSALDKEVKHTNLLLANIYLEEAIKILTSLFGLKSKFWKLWNLRKQEVFGASVAGKKAFYDLAFSIKDYEILCDSKSAFGKIALDALFVANNSKSIFNYEKLLESHKYFSVGFQINDDIEDFVEDFENKDFNFAYYKFIIEENKSVKNIKEAKKMLYISGFASELYQKSLFYFEKSYNIAKEAGHNMWLSTIEQKIEETKNAIISIEEYLTIIKTKVALIEDATKINTFNYVFDRNSIIEKGLQYLVEAWEKDYPEVKHIMILSGREDFENKAEIHSSDIFQRGLITNNLIDIAVNYHIDLAPIIDFEIDYLIKKRVKTGVGCWSYFPTVKEIAPDADDLGQMMQVFLKNGNENLIEKYCNNGIQILINECLDKTTGGIETWIVPKMNLTTNQKSQKHFNETKWGVGPDIDVMANFLYALCLENFELYKDVIENGVKFIFTKIEKEGYWMSRWYYGWLYGTMICVRLCTAIIKRNAMLDSTYSNVLNKIENYIISKQKEDGGWSVRSNSISDPLNTSFALATLGFFRISSTNNSEIINNGIDYLKHTQNQKGYWEAVPFIKPKLNEPYKSKVLTTSYVLNVLTNYNGKN